MQVKDFFTDFTTPFQTYPFSKVEEKDYMPLFKEALEMSKKRRDEIINNTEQATFENTIIPLEFHDEALGKVSALFFNLLHAERSDELQKIANEVDPLLTAYYNDLNLNASLFAKVKAVYDTREELLFDREQRVVVEKLYKSFVRNGALLSEEDKKTLRTIDEQLSKLGLKFAENSLKDQNAFTLFVDDEKELDGLEQDFIALLAKKAEEKGEKGKFCITLDAPTYLPVMKGCSNRELRQKIYMGNGQVAYKDNEFNNTENIKQLTKLRFKRAQLLGYANHAEYVLEERMAQSPKRVREFLTDLLVKAKPFAEKELAEVTALAEKLDGLDELYPWDWAYYSEKLRKEKFDLNDELLKPYLPLDRVVEGIFGVANRLYGLEFIRNDDIDVYHPEVTAYEVKEGDRHIGVFYMDLHPRDGKQAGAWATSFRDQCWKDGQEIRPHISIVCNFSRPTDDKPSLLTFRELTTIFHEFGHALHGLLSECHFPSISGTSVFWDFVELPSQVMENWCFEKECLELFAKHYKTGEVIPFELIEKIKASANFLEGYQTVRQLSLGFLDFAWHTIDTSSVTDVEEFEKIAMEQTALLPRITGTSMSCSFGHIFAGGYSAGYYSYKWAELLDAEAFERFKEAGIFNKDIATRFRKNILSRGGSDHPMNLFKKFNGKEPSVEPLLRRAGLI